MRLTNAIKLPACNYANKCVCVFLPWVIYLSSLSPPKKEPSVALSSSALSFSSSPFSSLLLSLHSFYLFCHPRFHHVKRKTSLRLFYSLFSLLRFLKDRSIVLFPLVMSGYLCQANKSGAHGCCLHYSLQSLFSFICQLRYGRIWKYTAASLNLLQQVRGWYATMSLTCFQIHLKSSKHRPSPRTIAHSFMICKYVTRTLGYVSSGVTVCHFWTLPPFIGF